LGREDRMRDPTPAASTMARGAASVARGARRRPRGAGLFFTD
jgi:hypothetical protein